MSKFHWICPLRKFTSNVIQDYLLKHIYHMYGIPECIVTDNGSQFRSNELNAFFTSHGIKHTALYCPQANVSESVNRSLIAGIGAYLKQDYKQWDQHLTSISCTLRNTIHQSIKCSPYHALYSFDMGHGWSCELLRNFKFLNEPSISLQRDDQLQLIRQNLRKHIKEEEGFVVDVLITFLETFLSKPLALKCLTTMFQENVANL